MSGRARRDVLSVASGSKLQPSVLQDSLGPHIVITCGSVSGKLYLSKLDESKKPLPKCICVNGNWCSPSDVESLAGKKAKKWKQSLRHLDKPLSDYILSGSLVRTGQQGSVVDNTGATGSVVGGHVSDNESVSVSPGGLTGLSDTLPVASQGGFVSPQTTCPAVPTSQSEQLRSSIDASVPVTNRPKPLLVDTVLSFIAAYHLKGDTDSLKKIVVERFSNDDVEAAKRLLWDYCSSDLLAKGLVFHAHRDSDRRSQLEAHLNDLLGAFSALDTSDSIPTICCEATSLLRIPPISLNPVAEQVHSNSQALRALSSVIEGLEKKLSDFLVSGAHSPDATGSQQVSYARAASSTPPEVQKSTFAAPRKSSVSLSPSSADDRSCNVILFGLPEGRSLVESKKVVDEVLEFISGKPIQIKDMFRLGKYIPSTSSSSRPRPILIKLCTAWDRKLVLLRKSSLKDFCLKRLFLREDVSPDHKLRVRKSISSVHPGDSTEGPSVSAASNTSPGSAALTPTHSSGDSSPSNVVPLSTTVYDAPSRSVHPTLTAGASQPSPQSSSTFSAAVVQGGLNDSHGSD